MSAIKSSQIGFITSFREFARNTSLRKKAIQTGKPIVVEDKKEKKFFLLVPPEMYDGLQAMYEDWRDSNDLQNTIAESKNEEGKDWDTLQEELQAA